MSENKEKPAKVWQVDAVQSQLVSLAKTLESVSVKQDVMLERQVTQKYVDDKIESVKRDMKSEHKLLRQKYDPYVDNAKWLTRTLIVAIIGQIVSAYFQIKG